MRSKKRCLKCTQTQNKNGCRYLIFHRFAADLKLTCAISINDRIVQQPIQLR